MPRSSYQFHWENLQGWENFDDYLSAMRAPVRKQIRRERRQAQAHGLTLTTRLGSELGDAEWDALWFFYRNTASHKLAIPYLTRQFFEELRQNFSHRVVATFAHQENLPVAGTLMFHRGQHLYGRYWGSRLVLEAMHFELCYYRPIDWCLQNSVTRFEAGAQGEHKLKRGFLPSLCRSVHWIEHPALAEAIRNFLPRESNAVDHEINLLTQHSPFHRC